MQLDPNDARQVAWIVAITAFATTVLMAAVVAIFGGPDPGNPWAGLGAVLEQGLRR